MSGSTLNGTVGDSPGRTQMYILFSIRQTGSQQRQEMAYLEKYNGIPCEVFRVRRMERQWYTVQFYTDSDWTHCSSK
jgi:hypothetical protein